ncbi:MAG: aa3-type cytochrome c oxidase subunit IV [Rhodospirillaceae bacterium]|nr:aa3-type cytochrome c oxidase subunit IV [Rhodospirillaceae bacterium]|tara:strand:+ start:535 stop:663 length:129 start_codon:yes stop_codon:yes gene_type:complete
MSYDPESYREDHRRMYGAFMRATTWGTGAVIAVVVLMAIFLL